MRTSDNYADEGPLVARQRLWATSRREPPFDLIPWVLDHAEILPGSTEHVLDLGCGNGRWLAALAEREHSGSTVGADLSYGMLSSLGDHIPRTQIDATALPFRDDTFDVVLAAHMLYHVENRQSALIECRRVLRPGGRMVATSNGPKNNVELLRMIESAVGGGWRMSVPHQQRFGMHNGAEQLAASFESIERYDCPVTQTIVTDPNALADYVASLEGVYADQVDVDWSWVVKDVLHAASRAIEHDGAVRLTSAVGAFVCR
ncbi:MAG: class I SAM-dependent methyltransferase [Microthrixaceae bacterium]